MTSSRQMTARQLPIYLEDSQPSSPLHKPKTPVTEVVVLSLVPVSIFLDPLALVISLALHSATFAVLAYIFAEYRVARDLLVSGLECPRVQF